MYNVGELVGILCGKGNIYFVIQDFAYYIYHLRSAHDGIAQFFFRFYTIFVVLKYKSFNKKFTSKYKTFCTFVTYLSILCQFESLKMLVQTEFVSLASLVSFYRHTARRGPAKPAMCPTDKQISLRWMLTKPNVSRGLT